MDDIVRQLTIFLNSSLSRECRDRVFESVWNEYHKKIHVFTGAMTGVRREEIDDMTQDIMLKVYHSLHRYNPVYSFSTWIYTIARNHCLDRLRKKTAPVENMEIINNREHAQPVILTENPAEQVISRETEHVIQEFLNSLDSTDKQISFLRFFEKLSYRRISRIIGIPEGTIKYRVYTIRSDLSARLEQYDEK
ncbi:RNA polymerase sigma factor [candidate division KSB1 bacterium]